MNNFPIVCVDNFYNDPDKVREFALSQEYMPSSGHYPGRRSEDLKDLDFNFYREFCSKLFVLCNITDIYSYFLITSFWQVNSIEQNINSYKNLGWIHTDDCPLGGVIYLTPDINKNLGTTIYRQVQEYPREDIIKNTEIMKKYYSSQEDFGFEEAIKNNNSRFTETAKIYNVYNRLVLFDGDVPHSPSHYYTGEETRLSQVFFLIKYNSGNKTPIQKVKSFSI